MALAKHLPSQNCLIAYEIHVHLTFGLITFYLRPPSGLSQVSGFDGDKGNSCQAISIE